MKHTIMRNIFICLLLVGFALKGAAGAEHPGLEKKLAADAELACEAFAACDRYLEGWCSKIDPSTGLLPQNLLNPDGNRWTAWNSAADNFPFMVIAARFTRLGFAEPLFRKAMIGEKKLTIGAFGLPVAYDLARGVRLDESLDRTIFGASEYAKDGLMPMLEILGPGA
ncbi:MAG: hypothetical protein U9N45_01055, partial [Gemmatimonadota bacterium]|nr:hypothetical protein [Gemmatimonadota bacterium]